LPNNVSRLAVANNPKIAHFLVLAFCFVVSGASALEAAATPERQHLCGQVLVCATDGSEQRAWVFPVAQQSQHDGFGMFFKFIPSVAPQIKPVPHKHAEQKAGEANQGGGVGGDRISVHLCLIIFALCFFFGFGIGLGPYDDYDKSRKKQHKN